MLKFANDLPTDIELCIVAWGQSPMRPWGTREEGFSEAPHLRLQANGFDLTGIVIEAGEESGSAKVLAVTTVLEARQCIGMQLRIKDAGTGAILAGYATVIDNTASSITVTWTKAAAASGTFNGYLTRTDERWKSYPMVRVLTPYQPEGPDVASRSVPYPAGAPILPGFTVPAGVATYEDLGLFLPFSFLEGIDAWGISDATHGVATAAATTTFDFTTAITAGTLAGGYLVVDHAGGRSWSTIGDSTANQLTGLSWQGAGTPTGTASAWTYTAWLPHYANNPHAYLPGQGFRYPNNDMQPCTFGDGRIHNRPRGITTSSYGNRFGPLLELAWRMANSLGRRINVVLLGINSSGQLPANIAMPTAFGFAGQLGWWDFQRHTSWSPALQDNIAARLKRLIQVVAPNALLAEGNTKKLKAILLWGDDGQADALQSGGRETFRNSLPTFYEWLRDIVDGAGMNPFPSGVRVPIVHNRIAHIPYELSGTFNYYNALAGITLAVTLSGDADSVCNGAITEFVARQEHAGTIEVDTFSKVGDHSMVNWIDPLHYDGVGEAKDGRAVSEVALPLIDRAFGLKLGAQAIAVCNVALANLGDAAQITSLDPPDGSPQASLCATYFPQALTSLLEMHAWSFNSRRMPLFEITSTRAEWAHAYVHPEGVLKARKVLPAGASSDDDSVSYIVELDDEGHRVIYTNTPEAHLLYNVRVGEGVVWPYLFRMALAWQTTALLAGAMVKGDVGRAAGLEATRMMAGFLSQAKVADAQQRKVEPEHIPPWFLGKRPR